MAASKTVGPAGNLAVAARPAPNAGPADGLHVPMSVPGAVRERDLVATVAREDVAEEAGTLDPDDRLTCHTCRAWATAAHISGNAHWQALRRMARTQSPDRV